MNCPNCGANISDTARFCTSCGSVVNQNQQPPYQQPNYQQPPQQPNYQQAPQPPQYQNPLAQALPMKWFKFLIYFSLFAGAVINIVYGFNYLTGGIYFVETNGEVSASDIYEVFEEMQIVDVIYGLMMLAIAAFGIFVRFRLAGFYANGPKLLNTLYIVSLVASLVYVIGVFAVVGEADAFSMSGAMIGNVIMIAANAAYFKKRAHLFVN